MRPERILVFKRPERDGRTEPVSPFRHLVPPRPLTPRQLLHRQRMLEALQPAVRRPPRLEEAQR